MPVIRKKMNALKKSYGNDKGEQVYYAMEKSSKKKKVSKKKKK